MTEQKYTGVGWQVCRRDMERLFAICGSMAEDYGCTCIPHLRFTSEVMITNTLAIGHEEGCSFDFERMVADEESCHEHPDHDHAEMHDLFRMMAKPRGCTCTPEVEENPIINPATGNKVAQEMVLRHDDDCRYLLASNADQN